MIMAITAILMLLITIPFVKFNSKGTYAKLTVLMMTALILVACADDSASEVDKEPSEPIAAEELEINESEDVKEQQSNKSEEIVEEAETNQNVKLNGMEVHFIDVGQADAALIQYDGYNILIDAGDWQGNEVVPYLKKADVDKLDIIVGSHPHADHIGQFDKVLNEFDVEEVWMSGGTNTSQLFGRVLDAITSSGANYEEPRTGDTYQVGDLGIEILSPSSLSGNLNDDSIVMRLSYGEISFLFTGDAERNAESSIVNSNKNIKSTILKAGHHGSDTSTTQPFLDKVDPEVVVISAAEKSKYNHPNKSVVDRINDKGSELYATKTHGNIVIKTDGKTYNVNTDKSGTVIPGDLNVASKSETVTPKDSNVSNKSSQKESVTKDSPTTPKKEVSSDSSNANCVNINTANKDELQSIKHIGDSRASDIIEKRATREFESVGELSSISGIGNGVRLSGIKSEGVACVK